MLEDVSVNILLPVVCSAKKFQVPIFRLEIWVSYKVQKGLIPQGGTDSQPMSSIG